MHAAAGGVGSLAVQLGKPLGAGPRHRDRLDRRRSATLALELGADAAVDGAAEGLTERLVEANLGEPVDVVFEMAGGAVFDASLAALAPFGRLVTYGIASGENNTVRSGSLMRRSRAVVGFWFVHCLGRPAMIDDALADLFERVRARRAARRHRARLSARPGRAGADRSRRAAHDRQGHARPDGVDAGIACGRRPGRNGAWSQPPFTTAWPRRSDASRRRVRHAPEPRRRRGRYQRDRTGTRTPAARSDTPLHAVGLNVERRPSEGGGAVLVGRDLRADRILGDVRDVQAGTDDAARGARPRLHAHPGAVERQPRQQRVAVAVDRDLRVIAVLGRVGERQPPTDRTVGRTRPGVHARPLAGGQRASVDTALPSSSIATLGLHASWPA